MQMKVIVIRRIILVFYLSEIGNRQNVLYVRIFFSVNVLNLRIVCDYIILQPVLDYS